MCGRNANIGAFLNILQHFSCSFLTPPIPALHLQDAEEQPQDHNRGLQGTARGNSFRRCNRSTTTRKEEGGKADRGVRAAAEHYYMVVTFVLQYLRKVKERYRVLYTVHNYCGLRK